MPPIDYSKWDNIDTDSDSDQELPPQPPHPATQSRPCSCDAPEIVVDPPWEATTIPTDHAVFNNTVPPVATLLDFPIVIHRLGTRYNGEFGNLDNQIITYLNVEAKSGLAPPRWQSGIGSVIVARKDRKDLSPEHYEAIWMYHDHLLDYFGEGPAPEHLYNRKAFDRWFVGYAKDTAGFGRKEWNSVAPLY
ncbi:hypothetical protein N7509_000844 [Penicillium cosmopolitanum]|uniref:Uncharacterized protein n=1 Tax=Penicillium cosmopolitanum TaxID=1131564 RepID=A0A9W9WBC1_9EURO|nr:uncharacterized protein N7509_000844 [Penicillium cosmopolitanum]KAJ5414217.1 hypothetical protein N7509_000844 [Penicillium cosmopolitanum]